MREMILKCDELASYFELRIACWFKTHNIDMQLDESALQNVIVSNVDLKELNELHSAACAIMKFIESL